jgi:hypothetical protein
MERSQSHSVRKHWTLLTNCTFRSDQPYSDKIFAFSVDASPVGGGSSFSTKTNQIRTLEDLNMIALFCYD